MLSFPGCPHAEAAVALAREVAAELGIDADVRERIVETLEEAARLRFLGSPTIRVHDRDVEPGAEARREFALACRVYETATGRSGLPERTWLADALRAA